MMPPRVDLPTALAALFEGKVLRTGQAYTRTELLQALAHHHDEEACGRLFMAIRRRSKRALDPGAHVHVHTTGAGRSLRYVFTTGEPPPASAVAASVQADSDAPAEIHPGDVTLYYADNLEVLPRLPDGHFQLIYTDPPFNTGKKQARQQLKTERDEEGGDRTGFGGKRYRTTVVGSKAYGDAFDDYLAFLVPRLEQAYRLLADDGSLLLHLDYREVHYAKVALDQIFGRRCFVNEIIWAYDYGARTHKRWPAKHDNILWYCKDPSRYRFNYDEMDRVPYMAPGLVGPEKAARGKTPTDVWWHTIVSPSGKEKTGYPTQKPLGVVRRIVKVHSSPGDRLLDMFAGSGTLGEAGAELGRSVVLIDDNATAIEVMERRLMRFGAPRAQGRPLDVGDHSAAP